jgi:two-component system, LytTR family, sensor kinase
VSRRALIGFVALGATAAGLYFATQLQLAYPPEVRTTWARALGYNLAFYWLWGAAVPLIAAIARRFPLDAERWKTTLPLHFLIGALVTVLQLSLGAVVAVIFDGELRLGKALRTNFHSSYPTYFVILLGVLAFRAARLRARLAEARLEALRGQLQPHFLFNTLNSISSLMYKDPAAADTMMARLAELLRASLRAEQRREIPLAEELALVEQYLAIERVRFEDRLAVSVDVAADAVDARIPPFLLQPLVENALRHALTAGGHLQLEARLVDGELRVTIADDGPGLASAHEGVGLANTRARLAELYGARGRLELVSERGVVATVVVPQ